MFGTWPRNEQSKIVTFLVESNDLSDRDVWKFVFLFEFLGPTWDLSNPTVLSLSLNPVMSIVISCDRLWCASGSAIFVVDVDTMLVEVCI